MLMKRIYTEKETIRFFPLYLLIPVIVVALYGFSEYGFSKIAYIYRMCVDIMVAGWSIIFLYLVSK